MTKINVKVITGARKEEIIALRDGTYRIKITAPPEKGRANRKIIEIFSKKLGVRKSRVRILSGGKSKNKVIEIL